MGRCGICGTTPADAAAKAAVKAEAAAAAAPPGAPPADPAPVKQPRPPRAPGSLGAGAVAATIGGVVVVCILLYLVVAVSGLHSDISGLKQDQQTAADRIQQLDGESSVLSSANDSLKSTLEAQAAADPTAVATRVQPSVYTIEVPDGIGSGWVAQSDGVTSKLVTNYHVVQSAVENGSNAVKVYQDQGAVLDGTVEQAVPDQDLALVSVAAALPVLHESIAQVKSGQAILVVGSPLGLGSSVSTGSIANPSRNLDGVTYVQFTAPISPGNSGGAVVDLTGEVIGVTEAKLVGLGVEGVGLAIPVTNVCTFLKVCA
jgi:putative serine protease PepD